MVPEIETARLRLRPLSANDLNAWAAVTSDPQVVRYLGGTLLTREETWRRILATAGSWTILGYGYWAVEAKGEARMIGQVGFADFKRELDPSIEGLPEMGWVFAPEAQGRGYASEAVAAALDWADETLKAREIVAIVDHANAGSIRVAEKAGFAHREEAQYRSSPILLFRRIKSA